tara:strand:- start:26180 stop:27343 length:1164 start_codon:yes stop_codon:yes gene_type:complete
MFRVAGLNTNNDFSKFLNGKDTKNIESIHSISFDSRKIKKGELFIPLKGEHFNGHNFVQQAVDKGAFALCENKKLQHKNIILVENVYLALLKLCQENIQQLQVKTIFITGSFGKTTLKEMLKKSLGNDCHASHSNQNNQFGIPYTILSCSSKKKYLIVECGARKKGDFDEISDYLKCDIFILTGIAHNHIETMGSISNIEKTKLELLKCLKNKKHFIDGRKLINQDYINNNIKMATKAIHLLGKNIKDTPFITEPPSGRGNVIKFGGGEIIDQTYNSSPHTLIETTKNLDSKKHILILGDMAELGGSEKKIHEEILKKLSKFEILVTGKIFGEIAKKKELSNIIYFRDIKSFPSKYLLTKLQNNKKLYFKGSRSSRMEIYINALING